MKAFVLAAAFALSSPVLAQALQTQDMQTQVAPALEVQRLAPQLVAFAGGDANFQNLVNGLAAGTPVTLVTGTQVVTFTPSGAMTALDIAQTLEKLRQQLIGRGIATPTAQQLAIALTGGVLPTAVGTTPVNGVIAAPQSPAVAIQRSLGTAAAGGTTVRSNVSDSPFPRGISDTPPTAVPGVTTGASSAAVSGAPTATTPAAAGNTAGAAAIRIK
jgi:hypothetical protein